MNNKKLIKSVKMARSMHIACFWAYQSHRKFAKDYFESKAFLHIMQDKFDHIALLESVLQRFQSKGDSNTDLFFEFVGKLSCFISKNINSKLGTKMVMWIESKCEKHCAESAKISKNIGLIYTAQLLYYMSKEQKRHEILLNKAVV